MRFVIALLLTAICLIACAPVPESHHGAGSVVESPKGSTVLSAMATDEVYTPKCETLGAGHHTVGEGMMVQATKGEGYWMGESFIRSTEAAMSDSSNTTISVPVDSEVQSCTWAQ